MGSGPWRIELFGVLTARLPGPDGAGQTITRFRTQKTAALLAYLAYFRDDLHPREYLVSAIWPESEPLRGRMSLRTALSSLRRQLEPPGVLYGSILTGDASAVQLNPAAVSTDVSEFEALVLKASRAETSDQKLEALQYAVEVCSGELLQGMYDEWIVTERRRLLE